MDDERPSIGHIDFAAWLFRLITWDGILPVCMILIPFATKLLFPIGFVVVAVGLPIVALFIRIVAGCRHIDENNCAPFFQKVQVWSLLFGVFLLIFIDTMLILMHEIPPDEMLAGRGGFVVVVMVLLYLMSMAIAMYPGPAKPQPVMLQLGAADLTRH